MSEENEVLRPEIEPAEPDCPEIDQAEPARESWPFYGQPWERQRCGPNPEDIETDKGYRAFLFYRDMPRETRSRRAVSGLLQCHRQNLQPWFRRWRWQERAMAWDNHCEAIEQGARDLVLADRAAIWEQRRQDAAEADWGMAESLREKLQDMMVGAVASKKALTLTTANLDKLAKLTAMMMQLQAAALANGRGLAADDGFDPLTASPEQCEAYLARHREGVKGLPAPA